MTATPRKWTHSGKTPPAAVFAFSRRILAFCSLLFAVGISARAATRAEVIREELLDRMDHRVLVIAHRGDWRGYPENSLPAIRHAIEMNVEVVEIDLGRTSDGRFVLMHDQALDRTTTGSGNVSDHTLAEIRQMRLRNGYGMPTPFQVPTLEEALAAAKGRVLLNLDKSYRYFRELVPILDRAGAARFVVMKNNTNIPAEEMMRDNGDLMPRVIFMPLVNFQLPFAAKIARDVLLKLNPPAMEIIFPQWRSDVAEIFELCRQRGTRIWVNAMWPELAGGVSDDLALDDEQGNYGRLRQEGVTMIQTDRPLEAEAYFGILSRRK